MSTHSFDETGLIEAYGQPSPQLGSAPNGVLHEPQQPSSLGEGGDEGKMEVQVPETALFGTILPRGGTGGTINRS